MILRFTLMTILACVGLFFFVPSLVVAQDATPRLTDEAMKSKILDEAHVRGFVWGLPSAVVKEQEPGTLIEQAEDGALFFVDHIDGVKSSLTYEFENDRLYRTRIFSERIYTRPQDRINDLATIKRYLDARFGEPIKEDFEWLSERDKKFPDQWGWTVYRGELNITITWQDEETFVTAFLGSKKPYDPVLFFVYEDAKARQIRLDGNVRLKP